jgi:uncharacterized protein YgfB (UPF0149 family)
MMEPTPAPPGYEDIERLLRESEVPTGACEAHGIITGVLCAPQGGRVPWPSLILGRHATPAGEPPALMRALAALHAATGAQLNGVDFEFAPLLPGEAHRLAEQIEGLTDWCRGFLIGLHAGGVQDAQSLPGDAGEIARDIVRFSGAELDVTADEEEQARALAEIVEYLRVGVQLLFEELQPPAARH